MVIADTYILIAIYAITKKDLLKVFNLIKVFHFGFILQKKNAKALYCNSTL